MTSNGVNVEMDVAGIAHAGRLRRRDSFCGIVQPRAIDRGASTARALNSTGFWPRWSDRALRIAEIGVRDRDEALDLVQDAMIKLARNYADRSIRRMDAALLSHPAKRARLASPGAGPQSRHGLVSARRQATTTTTWSPLHRIRRAVRRTASSNERGDGAASKPPSAALPRASQEAFMLSTFEGLDVRDTASRWVAAKAASRTHYSRAVHALRAPHRPGEPGNEEQRMDEDDELARNAKEAVR